MAKHTAHLLLALTAVLLPISLLIYWAQTVSQPEFVIAQVEHATTAAPDWPHAADWQDVTLPSRECRPQLTTPCYDHYRVRLQQTEQAQAVFIPQFIGSLRVALNDETLMVSGQLTEPVHNVRYQPIYLSLPAGLLSADSNRLQLTMASPPGAFHWIRPFYVGPHLQLLPFARPIIWTTVDANSLAIGIYLIALAFSVAMLAQSPTIPLYGWFAAFCLFSVMRLSYFLTSEPAWESWVTAAYFFGSNLQIGALTAMAITLTYTVRNQTLLKTNLLIALAVLLLLVGMTIDTVTWVYLATVATNLFFLTAGPVVIFALFRFWVQRRHWPSAWIFSLAVGSFAMTMHDVWHIAVLIENPRLQLSHVSPILMVAAFWWVVADERLRHLTALHQADQAQLEALQRQRSEIRRDLHDGVTSQLASLVLMARRKFPELVPHLEESLEDLRNIMDEFDATSDEVEDIVQDVHPKLKTVLQGHGVDSNWQISVQQGARVDSQVRRAIYLGLKECVHNALRHANASHMSFAIATRGDTLSLEIQDDGRGFDDVNTVLPLGHGLAGLQERLSSLGGSLSLHSTSGARVKLEFPLRSYG